MNNLAKQKTLCNSISAKGVGLHSGTEVIMTLKPAPENAGIIFRRVDLNPIVAIKVDPNNVHESQLSTSLHNKGILVVTVEHLLAAAAGLGIDNMYVDLTAEELPIMDGSASYFIFLLQSAGIIEQNATRQYVTVTKKIEVFGPGGERITLLPYDGFKITFSIDFIHPVFVDSNKSLTVDFAADCFVRNVSRARTFGFLKQYEYLKARNLAQGANLENTIVLDDDKIINEDGLRYPAECLLHKILDAIGDLYLLNKPLRGHFIGHKSGHALNHKLLKKLMQDEAYQIETLIDTQSKVG